MVLLKAARVTAELRNISPLPTFLMASSSSSGASSLSRYPTAPALSISFTNCSPECMERAIILTSGEVFNISLVASMPDRFGMVTSITTISGCSSFTLSMASFPSTASPTTSMDLLVSIIARTPARVNGWSSTSSILVFMVCWFDCSMVSWFFYSLSGKVLFYFFENF